MPDFRRFVVEEYPNFLIPQEEIEKAKRYVSTIENCVDAANVSYKRGDLVFEIVNGTKEESTISCKPVDEKLLLTPTKTVVYGVEFGCTYQSVVKTFPLKELEIPSLEAIEFALRNSGLVLEAINPYKKPVDYSLGIVAIVSVEF